MRIASSLACIRLRKRGNNIPAIVHRIALALASAGHSTAGHGVSFMASLALCRHTGSSLAHHLFIACTPLLTAGSPPTSRHVLTATGSSLARRWLIADTSLTSGSSLLTAGSPLAHRLLAAADRWLTAGSSLARLALAHRTGLARIAGSSLAHRWLITGSWLAHCSGASLAQCLHIAAHLMAAH